MSSDFWLGVLRSAIGSGLGFGLGIGAFHYQQNRQLTKNETNNWLAALDALNRLTTAAVANTEALVNAKLQFVNNLMPEVEKMASASEALYSAQIENRDNQVQSLLTTSNSLRYFFLASPRNSIMQPPNFSEYSSLSKEMPALTQYVHSAMSMMQELNERTDSRNRIIAEYAREGGAGTSITSGRIFYYSSMLSGEGKAICEQTDFALNFWRLVLDQIQAYRKKQGAGEHLLTYELIPKAIEAMPKKELFPLMREQLKIFAA